jgi:hypothetical protein
VHVDVDLAFLQGLQQQQQQDSSLKRVQVYRIEASRGTQAVHVDVDLAVLQGLQQQAQEAAAAFLMMVTS